MKALFGIILFAMIFLISCNNRNDASSSSPEHRAAFPLQVKSKNAPDKLPNKEVSLILNEWVPSTNKGYKAFNIRLSNLTILDVEFVGYSESSPWYKIQTWDGKKWIEHKVGWFCGTGLRSCKISANKSSLIFVDISEKLFPLRVGVDYSQSSKNNIVWSGKIELE